MNNVEKFFDKLNNEMKYLDPYKWLLDVEPEHIPEMITELQVDIGNLEESIVKKGDSLVAFIGGRSSGKTKAMEEYKNFIKMVKSHIEYKSECIDILESIKEDYDNEQQTN